MTDDDASDYDAAADIQRFIDEAVENRGEEAVARNIDSLLAGLRPVMQVPDKSELDIPDPDDEWRRPHSIADPIAGFSKSPDSARARPTTLVEFEDIGRCRAILTRSSRRCEDDALPGVPYCADHYQLLNRETEP
jgi:hypothetical protein